MKLDKKQIPQLVVLGLLVVLCIGYVSFTVLKPPATEAPPSPKNAVQAIGSGKAPLHPVMQPLAPNATFPDLNAPIPRRDPFTIQKIATASKPEHPAPISIKPITNATSVANAATKVPPLIPMGSFSTGSAPRLSVVPSAVEDPEFKLTGIIRGAQNVAIIRVGNSERHIVKQGQTINGRYTVLSVSKDSVVLACNERRIHLKLGGVRNAS